ncbi:MAG: YcxB family protein [Clostridiales bacterium]|nr:YcxB family protein [Candidatus Crickella caballi]
MAENTKIYKQLQYTLNDSDYVAFNRYHLMNSKDGKRIILRQKMIMLIAAAGIFALFCVFKVSPKIRLLVGIVCALFALYAVIFGKKMVLKASERAAMADAEDLGRVHPELNTVTFKGKSFSVETESMSQEYNYSDIYAIDMNEDGIYIWINSSVAMSVPTHAFRKRPEIKETYEWLKEKCGL